MSREKTVFVVLEDDVWAVANKMNVEIPEDAKLHVLHLVKKAIDSFCFDSPYNLWNAVEDAIKEALNDLQG